MIKQFIYLLVLISMQTLSIDVFAQEKPAYENYPVYKGNDLGVNYTQGKTSFKVWAPMASEVTLRLYNSGEGGDAISSLSMIKGTLGTWQLTISKNIKNNYYSFQVKAAGKWLNETPDIYATAVGINGKRGMIVDMKETNPVNWNKDRRPSPKNATDIVLYETHVRDISISANSGIKHKGKYLGLAEKGTKGPDGVATGLDHLKELGITHVHLLPSFDFNSVDEKTPELNVYNWGYDPLNYNVPEGSFSTDPYDGRVRIKEFKQMVQALHANGIGVILDVVYNHTSNRETAFNQFAPGYFYRHNPDGSYSDATGCGNETASERPMMRKFMIESMSYWVKEYHLDGFRVDLMGVHDIETMNQVSAALHKIDPSVFIYGEGWTAGSSPMNETLRAVKKNTPQLDRIAAFSDDLRDALRGPYSNTKERGFVDGKAGLAESLRFGIVGATPHPQVKYEAVNYSRAAWAKQPYQCINYVSCHDDPTLFDRLKEADEGKHTEEIIPMDKLAQTVVLTSQGVPFLHSGAEMLRTKQGVHNSYKSPDSINEIDWSRKSTYSNLFNYYKGLIALRKHHPSFRMPSTEMIQRHLQFLQSGDQLFLPYWISGVKGDAWQDILVLINGSKEVMYYNLPAGNWTLVCDGNTVNEKGISQEDGKIGIAPTSAYILHRAK